MPFTAFIAARLGTSSWAVGRRTRDMLARYDVVLSPREFAALKAEFGL